MSVANIYAGLNWIGVSEANGMTNLNPRAVRPLRINWRSRLIRGLEWPLMSLISLRIIPHSIPRPKGLVIPIVSEKKKAPQEVRASHEIAVLQ